MSLKSTVLLAITTSVLFCSCNSNSTVAPPTESQRNATAMPSVSDGTSDQQVEPPKETSNQNSHTFVDFNFELPARFQALPIPIEPNVPVTVAAFMAKNEQGEVEEYIGMAYGGDESPNQQDEAVEASLVNFIAGNAKGLGLKPLKHLPEPDLEWAGMKFKCKRVLLELPTNQPAGGKVYGTARGTKQYLISHIVFTLEISRFDEIQQQLAKMTVTPKFE